MIELLSPAGDMAALRAAVLNGADAVYLGGQALNARRGAGNFDADGLRLAVEFCHERGKRAYVTVNTLVKQAELPVLRELLTQLARAGADAAIASDLGAAMAIRQQLPSLQLHASTQMAVHNRHGVRFLRQSGFQRCVLARELTFPEIAECAQEGLALEAFCHGALCVSCSGQCLFSSLVGGRSGNRGMCAQPCRLPYRLVGPLAEASGYLLSPKDLMSLFQLDALRRAGVASLKIEGRLKRPEYVAIVTRAYREALSMDGLPPEAKARELMQIFGRGGFTPGYGPGVRDAELMFPERPNHCGVRVGKIERGRAAFDVPVAAADQIVIRRPGAEDAAYRANDRLPESGELFRLADDEQLRAARESYEGTEAPIVPLTGRALVRVGQPLWMAASGGDGVEAEWTGGEVQSAQNQPTTGARVREQMQKTGGTPYFFEALDIEIDEGAFVPAAQLNAGRRELMALISRQKIERARGCARQLLPMRLPELPNPRRARPRLIAQSGDASLLESARAWGADGVAWQPDDLTPEALAQSAPKQAGYTLALPMVCSDADLMNLHQFAMGNAGNIEGVLLSNPAHLALTWPGQASADFPLNIANDYGAALMDMPYTPSVELTAEEINQLRGDKRLVVYGRLPLMMLRHCPLAARLNPQIMPHADCRRCDRAPDQGLDAHRLIDRKGVAFPLRRIRTHTGCIARVLNSVPLMLLRHVKRLPEASEWRLIFEGESPKQVEAITKLHRAAIDGIDFKTMDEWKHIIEPMESTTGHYFRGVE